MPLTDVELAELRAIINEPSSFVFYKTLMEGVLERLDAAEQCILWALDTFYRFEQTEQYQAWLHSKGE